MTFRDRLGVAASPRRILVVGWIGSLLYAYPGYMTTEAVDELVDARVNAFTDWHSPVMTEIWRWLDAALSGPASMLVVQCTLLLAGMYHLLRRAMPARAAAIAAIGVLLCPPVLAATAVICPESLLAAFLAAGAAAVGSPRRHVQLGGLGLLLLACGLRDGASLAVLPILLLGFAWRAEPATWRRQLIAAGVWLVLVAGAAGLRQLVVDQVTGRRAIALATLDIAGVLRFAGPIDDAELTDDFQGVPLEPTADPLHDARLWYVHPEQMTSGPHRLFDPPTSAGARDRLIAARGRLVRAHLGAYLRYRWRVFARVLGLTRAAERSPLYTQFTEVPEQRVNLQFSARHSVIQRQLVHAVHALGPSFVFRPYLYFFVAVLALPFALVRRRHDAAMLLLSAIGYELALMFVTTSPEVRESHWMIAGTLVAVILQVARGIQAREATTG